MRACTARYIQVSPTAYCKMYEKFWMLPKGNALPGECRRYQERAITTRCPAWLRRPVKKTGASDIHVVVLFHAVGDVLCGQLKQRHALGDKMPDVAAQGASQA